jgi:hypothetical protein
LPAALERSGRALTFALAIAEAHSSTAGETLADTPAFAEVSSFVEGPLDAYGHTITEAAADPEVVPNPQTYSGAEARRGTGQRGG